MPLCESTKPQVRNSSPKNDNPATGDFIGNVSAKVKYPGGERGVKEFSCEALIWKMDAGVEKQY